MVKAPGYQEVEEYWSLVESIYAGAHPVLPAARAESSVVGEARPRAVFKIPGSDVNGQVPASRSGAFATRSCFFGLTRHASNDHAQLQTRSAGGATRQTELTR